MRLMYDGDDDYEYVIKTEGLTEREHDSLRRELNQFVDFSDEQFDNGVSTLYTCKDYRRINYDVFKKLFFSVLKRPVGCIIDETRYCPDTDCYEIDADEYIPAESQIRVERMTSV